MAGWPEEPSLPELEWGSSPCHPGPSSSPEGTTQGPQPRGSPSTDRQCDSGVHPLHDCGCSSQSKRLVRAPGCPAQRSAPAPAHTCLHTPAHLPLLQTSLGPQLCCRVSPAYARVWLLHSSSLQLSLPPKCQVAPRNLAAILCFSILGVSGRQRTRKHIRELDVPWMFNQERQDC